MKTHWARTILNVIWLVISYGNLQARDIIITKAKVGRWRVQKLEIFGR